MHEYLGMVEMEGKGNPPFQPYRCPPLGPPSHEAMEGALRRTERAARGGGANIVGLSVRSGTGWSEREGGREGARQGEVACRLVPRVRTTHKRLSAADTLFAQRLTHLT
jgi:hypothetical protein